MPWRSLPIVSTLLCFAFAVTAIWVRNRDILRDLYDYSSVIVAAGKIEAGLRPYTDFRSTMQSATYALNRGVELIFGANYLALTWGGLLVSLGGGAVLVWLWRRSFGWFAAAVLGGTVAVAGLSQHVVIFYNPVGLLCFAIVAVSLAHDPRLWRLRSPETVLACLALVLGGTNKINFHAFACGVAALFIARAWWMKECSLRSTLLSAGMLVLCGAALPLGLELLWTGATPGLWIDNVILLPSERIGFVTELLHRDIILRPAYDLYHHFTFKQLTLVGLGLLAGTAFAAWRALAGSPNRPRAALWLLIATPTFAIGSILLTVTNVESLALTSLPFVIGAAALWSSFSGYMQEKARHLGVVAISAAGLLWAAVGGYASWEGSRVLFGAADPNRASFVRLENPPLALAYLDGVRLDAGLHLSLAIAAKELEQLQKDRANLAAVLFGPAMEWMERAYPESIIRGMPVWYHNGTALRSSDGPWLKERLASHRVDRILLHPAWENWPLAFQEYLDRDFTHREIGPTLRLYEARMAADLAARPPPSLAAARPLMFCRRSHSNIHLTTTRFADMDYCDSQWGEFLGRAGSSRWSWRNSVSDMSGTFVAVLPKREGPPVPIHWRIVAGADSHQLAVGSVILSPDNPEARATFELKPQAEVLRFEIDLPAGEERVRAGWRDLWIKQAGAASSLPPPLSVDTSGERLTETDSASTFFRHAEMKEVRVEGDWFPAPFEAWRDAGPSAVPWKVMVNTKRRRDIDGTNGSPTIVFLVWYKGGRIEILRETMVNPDDEETVELEGWKPEPGGWMGVFARAADVKKSPNCRVRIESWDP